MIAATLMAMRINAAASFIINKMIAPTTNNLKYSALAAHWFASNKNPVDITEKVMSKATISCSVELKSERLNRKKEAPPSMRRK